MQARLVRRMASVAADVAAKPIIAMGQMCSTSDVEMNLQLCRKLCVEAKAQGACFLSLPECFEFMGTPGTGDSLAMAQPLDSGPVAASSHDRAGSLFSRYQKLAKEHKLWLSLGGFHERTPADDPKMYNTHAIVSDQGALVAAYRKLHLFDVDYDGGFRESQSTHNGAEALLVTGTPVGNVGVTVCYDLRFPELFSALQKAGADVILVPSAFMPTTGAAHWDVLLRARAIETQCYIGAAAQWGAHNPKRSSHGHALLVGPWGTVLGDCGAEGDGVVTAEIDFAEIDRIRTRMPCGKHRRPEVVDVVVGDEGRRLKVVDASASMPAANGDNFGKGLLSEQSAL